MSILDQHGNPLTSRRFAHAASRNRFRGPSWKLPDIGVDQLIPMSDRKTLSALSRRLVFNQGPAKEAIRQKSSYSVGRAWTPLYNGADAAAGNEAASWLQNVWYPLCDVRGNGHDWHEMLETVSKCMDRDGEAFVLLTQSREGFPQLQQVPSYQVWSKDREDRVEGGPYRGLRIEDGVIFDRRRRAVAFRVNYDSDGNDFRDITSRDLIHVYDSDFPEQRRGFPAFAHALEDLKNSMSSSEMENIRQNIVSSLYLVEKSPNGPDPDDPAWIGDIDTADKEAVLYEQIAPGIRHISADNDIEVIKHENPGSAWTDFNDRLLRSAILGAGWSYGMVWKSPGQGTAERADVLRARRAVEARQKRLLYVAKRAATYAIAKASETGRYTVEPPGNMLAWSFSLPERLTVDDGREARAMREAVEKGLCSEQEYQIFKGRDYEQHCREQALAKVTRAKVAREVTESNDEGVTVNPAELGVHDIAFAPAGDQAIEQVDPSEQINPDEDVDPDEDVAVPQRAPAGLNIKETVDAYGAAVRAGAITPQTVDEDHFRSMTGLPKLSDPAQRLWRKQGGTRSPITLAVDKGPTPPTEGDEQ